jgi:hypothetical protein
MLLTEWNTDDAIKVQRQEAFEDGINEGIKLGEQRSAATIAAQAAKIAALEQLLARTRQ